MFTLFATAELIPFYKITTRNIVLLCKHPSALPSRGESRFGKFCYLGHVVFGSVFRNEPENGNP